MKNFSTILEKDGGFVVPREILDRLHLKDGDSITIESKGEKLLIRKDDESLPDRLADKPLPK